nr:nonstructural protein 2 [Culex densovirus]
MESVCSEHSPCEHGNIECECIFCWEHDAQCKSRRRELDLGEPTRSERGMANNYEQSRNEDLYCTETVPSSAALQSNTITERDFREDFTDQTVDNIYPQLHSGSRASEQLEFAFPTIGTRSWEILIRQSYEHLKPDYKEEDFQSHIRRVRRQLFPEKTMVITGHRQAQPKCYETTSKDAVLKALLTAQAKITEMELMGRASPPWIYKATVLLTHMAMNRQQAVRPERNEQNPRQNQVNQKNIKAAIINKIYKNKAVPPPSPADTISSTESWMEEVNQIEKQHTTHSSSTKITAKRTGDISPQQGPSKRRALSPLITETTSTSSSHHQIQEETAQESEPESPSFLVQQAQEMQKRLSHFPKLNFSGTTFSIASVTVSKQSISMEIKSNNN